ncbi:MAG: magnesium transporter CorA family protein [Bacteroidales bacterium]
MIETVNFGKLKWLHILNPSEEDLQFLEDTFKFHPLDIEDCRSTNQRPKIDIYDDYNFLILHFPSFDKQTNKILRAREIKIFWGPDYIITLGRSHWNVKALFNITQKNPEEVDDFVKSSSDALLYTILNRLMIDSYSLLLRISAEIELINRELFNKKAVQTIERISVTRRNIILLNTIFKPQLRLFHKFESGEIKGYSPETMEMEDYWGNILDSYQKMWDMVEDNGELIEGLAKTFDSLQTNRTNEIVKIMTFISTLFLPLTFLTGLYGMNVDLPFMEKEWIFGGILLVMICFAFGFIYFSKKQRWL